MAAGPEGEPLDVLIAEEGDKLLLGVRVPLRGDLTEDQINGFAHAFALLLDRRKGMWKEGDSGT